MALFNVWLEAGVHIKKNDSLPVGFFLGISRVFQVGMFLISQFEKRMCSSRCAEEWAPFDRPLSTAQ